MLNRLRARPWLPGRRRVLRVGAAFAGLVVGLELVPEPRGTRIPPPPGAVMAGEDFAVSLVGCQDEHGNGAATRSFICALVIRNTGPERSHLLVDEIALGRDGRVLASYVSGFHTNVLPGRAVKPTVRLAGIDRAQNPEQLQVVVRVVAREPHRVVLPFAWGGPGKLPLIPFDLGK
ncbi:hypothetical protein [Longimicrobium sp.]|uniref:hypothetical protein n=1 Tax=Longimicrobium sp. TaxID=2029185 RepID=UPI002E320A94|nr:hypothetical protein [Longimicrobium sp.]HEX6038550.1 hypothetical protein [Longimicrobium sp.]